MTLPEAASAEAPPPQPRAPPSSRMPKELPGAVPATFPVAVLARSRAPAAAAAAIPRCRRPAERPFRHRPTALPSPREERNPRRAETPARPRSQRPVPARMRPASGRTGARRRRLCCRGRDVARPAGWKAPATQAAPTSVVEAASMAGTHAMPAETGAADDIGTPATATPAVAKPARRGIAEGASRPRRASSAAAQPARRRRGSKASVPAPRGSRVWPSPRMAARREIRTSPPLPSPARRNGQAPAAATET
mmetsp:Transcript_56536/g.163909  ORF Transcript_56536/g.163909 Transcript_56536/m.163909 type:complete len:251 (+) Transcript_56536:68-820(+)